MKLTVDELRLLKPRQRLWYHDNRGGAAAPKSAVLVAWQGTYRFVVHIVDEEDGYIDSVTWSLNTNGPLNEMRMSINSKVWLALRD
jgi:hypothetical protein